jgi:hypothetical protein
MLAKSADIWLSGARRQTQPRMAKMATMATMAMVAAVAEVVVPRVVMAAAMRLAAYQW